MVAAVFVVQMSSTQAVQVDVHVHKSMSLKCDLQDAILSSLKDALLEQTEDGTFGTPFRDTFTLEVPDHAVECRLAPAIARPLVNVKPHTSAPKFLTMHSRRIVVLCKPLSAVREREARQATLSFAAAPRSGNGEVQHTEAKGGAEAAARVEQGLPGAGEEEGDSTERVHRKGGSGSKRAAGEKRRGGGGDQLATAEAADDDDDDDDDDDGADDDHAGGNSNGNDATDAVEADQTSGHQGHAPKRSKAATARTQKERHRAATSSSAATLSPTRAAKIAALTKTDLKRLINKVMPILKGIFRGERRNWRHEAFKKGGKTRANLRYQVCFGAFTERQREFITSRLVKVFCASSNKYLPYAMDVLLPELLIEIYKEVLQVGTEEAEKEVAKLKPGAGGSLAPA